jgi:hypothetical protein
MPTPVGQISLSQVNTELAFPATATITMNDTAVRTLAGVPTGAISMTNLQGKGAAFAATISSPQLQMDLFSFAAGAGYPPTGGAATITVAPGVYIWSNNTGVAAMTIPNGFGAGNLTLINNGFIMGRGGDGAPAPSLANGSAGGPAISINQPVTINNTNPAAFIGGGGGGGGGGANPGGGTGRAGGAGGVGGGGGGVGGATPTAGGSGGAIGGSGSNGTADGGGGGGRVFPGTSSGPDPGSGGVGNPGGGNGGRVGVLNPRTGQLSLGGGGGGGGWGAAGGAGAWTVAASGPPGQPGSGGAANNVGGNSNLVNNPKPGGAGGRAVNLNGSTVTWTSGNTTRVWGAVA